MRKERGGEARSGGGGLTCGEGRELGPAERDTLSSGAVSSARLHYSPPPSLASGTAARLAASPDERSHEWRLALETAIRLARLEPAPTRQSAPRSNFSHNYNQPKPIFV